MVSATTVTRKRVLRCMGATALVASTATSVLFILFSISSIIYSAPVSVMCIMSTITGLINCLLTLVFTICPLHTAARYRLCGAVSSFLSVVFAATTLAWMNLRRNDIPPTIMGKGSADMAVAGFAVFIVTAIAQTTFWTTIVLSNSNTERRTRYVLPRTRARTHMRKPSKPVIEMMSGSSPTIAKDSFQSQSTVRSATTTTTKHNSLISQIMPLTKSPTITVGSQRRGSHASDIFPAVSPKAMTRVGSITISPKSAAPGIIEVNHFDAWETSDLSVQQRVAASLAEVELEAIAEQEAAQGLGIVSRRSSEGSIHSGAIRPVSTIYETDAQIRMPQRQSSPPLPENELTPRAFAFPAAVKTAMNNPRPQVRRGSQDSCELRGAIGPGGTGKWIGGSRARTSAEMAYMHQQPLSA